jgi:copper chaperone
MSESHQIERTYQVRGMTCDHCVAAVKEEVSAVKGAEDVAVDLESGRLVVRGRGVEDAPVRAAVEEAGYSLD